MRNIKPSQIGCPALFLDMLEELEVDLEDITQTNIEERLLDAIKGNKRLQAEYPHLKTFLLYQVEVIKNQSERIKKYEADNPPREWDELYEKRFPSIWAHLQGWMHRETTALKDYQEAGGKPDYYITANFLAKEHRAINESLRIEEINPPKHFFKFLSEYKDLNGNKLGDGKNNAWVRQDTMPNPTTPRKYLLGDAKNPPKYDLFERMKPVRVYYLKD